MFFTTKSFVFESFNRLVGLTLSVHWNPHPCGWCLVFSSLFPESVSNTRSLQPPFLLSAFRKFLSMTLEKQGSSIFLRIPVGHNWPPEFKCLPWSSVLDPPATCEVNSVGGEEELLQQAIEVMWLLRVPLVCSHVVWLPRLNDASAAPLH